MNKKLLKDLQWHLEELFNSAESGDYHQFEDAGMDIITRKDEFRPALIELLGEPRKPGSEPYTKSDYPWPEVNTSTVQLECTCHLKNKYSHHICMVHDIQISFEGSGSAMIFSTEDWDRD